MLIPFHQALDEANAFMEASGIRRYCVNICKGDCCHHGGRKQFEPGGRCAHPTICHSHLPCVDYMCYQLRKKVFTDDQWNRFNRRHDLIKNLYYLRYKAFNTDSTIWFDPYFGPALPDMSNVLVPAFNYPNPKLIRRRMPRKNLLR